MFDWGGFGIGMLYGITIFLGAAIVVDGMRDELGNKSWIMALGFVGGCALIGGLS